jgi:hypothetical protein
LGLDALLINLTKRLPSFFDAPLISIRVCDACARMLPPTGLYALGTNFDVQKVKVKVKVKVK